MDGWDGMRERERERERTDPGAEKVRQMRMTDRQNRRANRDTWKVRQTNTNIHTNTFSLSAILPSVSLSL